jgi:hypothetical protein
MQDEQTVTFQSIEVSVPWYIGLFRLYLVFVTLLAVFRFAQLLWTLRTQRIARDTGSPALNLPELWQHSHIKALSFKTLAQLTLLIAVTVLAWSLSGDLMQVATQKTSGVGAVAGAFADALKTFSAGMIVSTALFSCAVFCERLIHRHRLGLARSESVRPTYNDEKTHRERVLRCSFCQKSQDAVAKLISSPSDYPRAYICDECVAVCNSILEDDRGESRHPATAASGPNCSKTIQREEVGDEQGDASKNQPRDEAALGREEDRGGEAPT